MQIFIPGGGRAENNRTKAFVNLLSTSNSTDLRFDVIDSSNGDASDYFILQKSVLRPSRGNFSGGKKLQLLSGIFFLIAFFLINY